MMGYPHNGILHESPNVLNKSIYEDVKVKTKNKTLKKLTHKQMQYKYENVMHIMLKKEKNDSKISRKS